MKAFTLKEVVAIADPAYCPEHPGLLLQYLDENGKLISNAKSAKVEHPDTLALFIVREISDVIQGEDEQECQRDMAAHAMNSAIKELSRVSEALQEMAVA